MLRILKFSLFILLVNIIAAPVYGQVGIKAVPFLNIEPDARSSGVGFTGITQIGGANSSYWNPSLLAHQKNGIVSLSHFNWLSNVSSGITYDHVSISTNLTSKNGIAVDFTYFDLGNQLARDESGNELGSFGNSELALRVAYGHKVGRRWSFGGALQYFRSSLAAGQNVGANNIRAAKGLAIDLGGFYQKEINLLQSGQEQFRFGYNLSSFGYGVKYYADQERQALPTKLRAGWSYEIEFNNNFSHRFTFTNEFSKRLSREENAESDGENDYRAMDPFRALFNSWGALDVDLGAESGRINTLQQLGTALGGEYWFDNLLALRLGYFHENRFNGDRQLYTLGTGVRIDRFGVDLSYINSIQNDHPLDNTIKLTVLVNFNRPSRTTTKKPQQVCCRPVYLPVVQESTTDEQVVKKKPNWAPIDTIYVNLSEEITEVQYPESESHGEFTFQVDNPAIANKYNDRYMQLNRIGTTKVQVSQEETADYSAFSNYYILVVKPDQVFEFENVNFDFDKDSIRDEDRATLDHVVDIMSRYEHVEIMLSGHTDIKGSRKYNVDLSERRSEAVKMYLIEKGISADRIEMEWYAFDTPVKVNTTPENRFSNRRVEITQIEND